MTRREKPALYPGYAEDAIASSGLRVACRAMLSRRHLLIGSSCVALASPARAETAPDDFTVLRATPAGFDGAAPGPVIRVRRGDEVKVRLLNGLGEPTAIHWHGVRLPNAMDGAPPLTQAAVAPAASFDYRFAVPDAGTFWYRAAPRRQLERGLYGALIVAEPGPPPTERDHLLIFADRLGEGGGTPPFALYGIPALDVPARPNERLRLRFLNASTSQVMNARIDGHRVFVMALDGEPAEPFASRDSRISLGPGNRADVFVDATLAPGSIAPIVFAHEGGEAALARIVYEDLPARAALPGQPGPLLANPLPARMSFSRALRVVLPIGTAAATDAARLPQVPLFTAERGRTVVMALDNRDAGEHVVHLHGHHVRLLDRLDDGWKPYWLDTIVAAGRQTTRIAYMADNPGRWLIEHHALDGPAAGMTWFQVN
jgi:FtsP/CotA-like multicopper oxidase with cupredoxin domain